jgi:hypothetical protein
MQAQKLAIPILFCLPLATQPLRAAETPPDICKALCFNYRQLVILERAEAAEENCSNYVSPLADPVVIRVRLAPELKGTLETTVDDVLNVTINGNKVFEKTLSNDGTEAAFRKASLAPGCNTLALNYFNTQPPDAHFVAQLGGVGFCSNENFCQTYKEGLTFGTGVLARVFAKGNPVIGGQIWKSRLENPNASGCHCQDP